MKIWQKKSEEILNLLDELILQQHLKATAYCIQDGELYRKH